MQVWPPAAKIPATAPVAARSRSASSKTMLGDFPPSSRVTGTRLRAAASAIARPAATLPVKLILSRPGCATSAGRPRRGHR